MKPTTNIIYLAFALFTFACFALAPATDAQCPQICDALPRNTAFGNGALVGDSGTNNTAIGDGALDGNTTGHDNTATGEAALGQNEVGFFNTGTGGGALGQNTTGSHNTATGAGALIHNTTGNSNTADGDNALLYSTTGSNNIALGANAGEKIFTGSDNIDIGNVGNQSESGAIRIGRTQIKTFIAGISGATVPTGVAVIVDSDGHLGSTTSSARFKEAIKPMDKASEAILALKPVTFRYKKDLDPEGIA